MFCRFMFTVSKTLLNIDATAVFLFICLHTHHKGMSHHTSIYIAQTECVTVTTNTTNKKGGSDNFQHDYDEISTHNFIAIFFWKLSFHRIVSSARRERKLFFCSGNWINCWVGKNEGNTKYIYHEYSYWY